MRPSSLERRLITTYRETPAAEVAEIERVHVGVVLASRRRLGLPLVDRDGAAHASIDKLMRTNRSLCG